MLFMAKFGTHANLPGVREQNLEAHLQYLRDHSDRVLLSATMRHDPAGATQGFVWLIKAEDMDAAKRLCEADPFWTAGLRTTFELLHLTKALPDLESLV